MSQSPPSFSPIRRALQHSPSSPESGGGKGATSAGGGAALAFGACSIEKGTLGESESEEEAAAAVAAPANGTSAGASSGVMVLGGGRRGEVSSGESDEEQMEQEGNTTEMGSACASAVDVPAQGARPQPDLGQAEDEEDEDEDEEEEEKEQAGAKMEVKAEAEAEAEAEEEAEEEADMEEEEPMAIDDEPEAQAPQRKSLATPAAKRAERGSAASSCAPSKDGSGSGSVPRRAEALVPMDEVEAGAQIVAVPHSPQGEAWGGSLPPEATDAWTVAEDICSLQVGGVTMKLPRAVYNRLYGYQRQGVAWMWNLYTKSFGGILADEMGLGKTVQTAALLACLKITEQGSRFLIVAPVTLLEQWKRELGTWARDAGIAVHVMQGTPQEQRTALSGFYRKGGALLISFDLVRTKIGSIRTAGSASSAALLPQKRKRQTKRGARDDDSPSEAEEEPLPPQPVQGEAAENIPWDVVIVDEGHQIKNPSCVSGKALRKIDSRCRFLLTGTPLQNKLSDLWALMDFAQPALLGNHATFEKNFSDQIAKGSKRNASRFAVELKDHLARELKRLTAPHFLRRLKSDVSIAPSSQVPAQVPGPASDAPAPTELPQKTDIILWLNLTQAQQELYNVFLDSDIVRRATGESKIGMEALRAIAMLKKLCNHPMMCLPPDEFNQWRTQTLASGGAASSSQGGQGAQAVAVPDPDDGPEADATQQAVECNQVLPRLRALVPSSVEGAALLSCKLRVLSVLLPQLQRRGHRALIFSSSTRMLDLIQACVLRPLALKFLRIDGTIEAKDRDLKLQKFHQPESRYFCLCLSVQVGGTGLTITGADRVILVDPAWNPSADAQAIDRVHRIGQQKEVVVYRLIGSGAIEDKMFRLQVFKRGLSKTYLEQEQQVRFFTHKQLKQLFEPPNQSTSTQSLMAEQIGAEALEHEDLLGVVAGDIGSTDDPQALPFWQSSDVLGFSDYNRFFMFLEQASGEEAAEADAGQQAKALAEKLKSEEYVKDQVVDGKWRPSFRDGQSKENMPPQQEGAAAAEPLPLQDAQ